MEAISHLKGKQNGEAIRAFVKAFDLIRPGNFCSTDSRILQACSTIGDVLKDLVKQATPEEIVDILLTMEAEKSFAEKAER